MVRIFGPIAEHSGRPAGESGTTAVPDVGTIKPNVLGTVAGSLANAGLSPVKPWIAGRNMCTMVTSDRRVAPSRPRRLELGAGSNGSLHPCGGFDS